MNKTIRSIVSVLFAMALAAPSYAHWGAVSPFAYYNADAYCTHADAGNTNVRRARVRVTLHWIWNGLENGGGSYLYWDNVQIKNVSTSGRVDAVAVYFAPTTTAWNTATVNDLNKDASVIAISEWVNPANSPTSAVCQVRNG